MTFDSTLYRPRPEIKDALKAAKMTQGEFARRCKIVPSTFSGKLNGLMAMDANEEKKVLLDIQTMGEA